MPVERTDHIKKRNRETQKAWRYAQPREVIVAINKKRTERRKLQRWNEEMANDPETRELQALRWMGIKAKWEVRERIFAFLAIDPESMPTGDSF